MKKLSDYKGEEAIELWANILDPAIEIVGDKKIGAMIKKKFPVIVVAREVIKTYPKQTCDLLLAIDPTPLDGINIITRLVNVVMELGQDESLKSFFGYSAEKTQEITSGSATENTGEDENQDSSSDT